MMKNQMLTWLGMILCVCLYTWESDHHFGLRKILVFRFMYPFQMSGPGFIVQKLNLGYVGN